jgi:hypothetical protein
MRPKNRLASEFLVGLSNKHGKKKVDKVIVHHEIKHSLREQTGL